LEKSNRVDFVIMSSQLKDDGTEESVKYLISRLPGIPILAIIPFEGSSLNIICRESGCLTTVPKPILPARLLRALHPYLS
jgi:AmiR/NasT family two-component response regulator